MEAYFGSHFSADDDQSIAYRNILVEKNLIMDDGSLKGPANRYSVSELWCYIYYLWSHNVGTSNALSKMSNGRGTFDKSKAVDVVLAVYNTWVSPDATELGFIPDQLFSTIKHLPYV